MRDLNIGIKNWDKSNKEALAIFQQFDKGIFPTQSIERIYFHDFKTLLRYITPKLASGRNPVFKSLKTGCRIEHFRQDSL